jgi:iron complex outermembrane receptor protein
MHNQAMLRVSLAFLTICCGLSTADAQVASNANHPEQVGLEEIVVTANKRAESIQNVPSSVLALTAATLQRANVRDFDDLISLAPNMTITKTSQPANNSINIRGIGTYSFSIATQASTAVVVDDIPQAFQAEAFTTLADVQQIEILRGPQSTLFGKSASAGVINITTQAPSDVWTGRVSTMATNDHEERVQASISGPISDTLKFRLSGNISDYRGNLHNLTTGSWLDGAKDETLRANVVWQPSADWTVTLLPYVISDIASCCAAAPFFISPGVTFSKSNLPLSLILQGITPSSTNTSLRNDVNAQGDSYEVGTGFKVAHDFSNGLVLTNISSYDHYTLHDLQDTDVTSYDYSLLAPAAPHGGSANGGYFAVNTVTEELRLTSPSIGKLKYVAGGYFSDSRSQRDFVRGSNTLGTYNGATSIPTSNSSAYSSYLDNADIKTSALFGQADYNLTDRFTFVGGLRLHREDVSYNFWDKFNNVYYGYPQCSTKSPTLPISTCNNNTVLLEKAALEYHFTPDVMVFADYASGYKGLAYDLTSTLTTRTLLTSGPLKGFPIADAIAARQPITPEKSKAYEIGMKSSFLERRVTWNITGFYEEFTGFQAQSRNDVTNQNQLQSIGEVTTSGVETEFSARPIPELTLTSSGAFDIAKIVSFPLGPCFTGQTVAQGCVNALQDLSGRPLPNAPKWSANLNAEYARPITGNVSALIDVAYRWQSQVTFNLNQDPDSVQSAYGLFNLTTGLEGKNWRATVFVRNLFDTHYALTRGRSAAYNISPGAAPFTDAISWTPGRDSVRYFGGEVSVSF